MGQILTKCKITLDKAGAFDTHYNKLTVGSMEQNKTLMILLQNS